ncbi:sulfur carrier protein ThiS [Thiomicrorhabdus indica]|uniref:sulfur carrier protein ThiS n=1 Tax=Thiomicrorhabdus indica TaxID=2267253 RepID=UPI00102DF129|nr:sulfur carrier protein ThiS [Thiomicrorhabdus indica]
MKVLVNMQQIEVSEAGLLAQALHLFGATPPFAVMVNEEFIPKSQQEGFVLKEGDKVEVLGAIQGG